MNLKPMLNKKVRIILIDKLLKRETTLTGIITEATSKDFWIKTIKNETIYIPLASYTIKRIDEL